MTIKSDRWIRRMATEHAMIDPFTDQQIRAVDAQGRKVISYGVSSYGYDMRVAPEFKIFTNVLSAIVDPKEFDSRSFVEYEGDVCIVPPNSFALARSVEYFRIPRNVLTICVGKSTYARCGVITNVEPSLQAAFVDFGLKKQGFLPFSDVAPHAYRSDHASNVRTITDALKRKQRITVQVLKEELGNKGAALSTYVSLPGRYLVLMPNGDGAHISRKIEDEEERKRIKAIARSLDPPENVGLIVRTAGMEQPKEVLQRDLGDDKYRPCPLLRNYVAAQWLGRKTGRGFYVYH